MQVERDVQEVRKRIGESWISRYFVERRVDQEQFAGDADRVEHQEERVAAPGQQVRNDVQNVQSIVQVAGDLGQRPAADDQENAKAALRSGERADNATDDGDLHDGLLQGNQPIRWHQTDHTVHHLDDLDGLENGEHRLNPAPQSAVIDLRRRSGLQDEIVEQERPPGERNSDQ